MKKILLAFLCSLCLFPVFAATPARTYNLTKILNQLSVKYRKVISFSPSVTNTITPKTAPSGKNLDEILSKILAGTNLSYKVIGGKIYAIIVNPAPEPPVVIDKYPPRFIRYHIKGVTRHRHAPHLDFLPYVPHPPKMPAIALKTNLLYDASASLSIGAEFGISRHFSLDIPFTLNLWKLGDMSLRHFSVMPGLRYWTDHRSHGSFFSAQLAYAHYNVGDFPNWGLFAKNMQENHYKGDLAGISLSYGYAWKIAPRWNMEAEVGVGYARLMQDKYSSAAPGGDALKSADRNYFGPTRLSLSVSYTIK